MMLSAFFNPHCETCEKVENAAIKIFLKSNENENVPAEANLGEIDENICNSFYIGRQQLKRFEEYCILDVLKYSPIESKFFQGSLSNLS
jgi:hypothetical protein